MSEIEENDKSKTVHLSKQDVGVTKWWNGDIEVHIYNIPELEFQSIAAITGSEIHVGGEDRWLRFARARDGTRVVLFQE